ncbi:MAG: YeeE/YedE family protein, partial [Methylobacteriaceae bacterium]
MNTYASGFAGGALVGLSVALLMLLNGRIAGISGLVAGLGRDRGLRRWVDAAFVAGLIAGPPVFALATGAWPAMWFVAPLPVLSVSDLLFGFGT